MRFTKVAFSIALWIPMVAVATIDSAPAQTKVRRTAPISRIALDVRAPDFDKVGHRGARARLKKAWRTYSKAVVRFAKAEKTKSRTVSARLYQRAAVGFDAAIKQLDGLSKRYARDLVVRHEECRLLPVFGNASRISHLDLASAYASRGSYKMAQDAVDQVLRRNPLDQEARRLAGHIQLLRAASSGF